MLLPTQKELEKLFNVSNRRQNIENENEFSEDAIWSATDNFTYDPEDEIIFVSYFRKYEDLFKTDCANLANFKKVNL